MLSIRARFGLILSLASGLFATCSAQAYDVDTHFYATYAMARFAGIDRDVSAKIATSAQWMDENYLSDPTSMILMPITGVAKRRLLHFPASRVLGVLAGSVRDESYGIKEPSGIMRFIVNAIVKITNFDGDLRVLAINQQTEPNHEFANALIMQGLKEGNLMKCGAGLHTLEDSYAHAGTAPIEGHAQVWHWPDRPFASVAKYQKMTATVFKAMAAIRAQLPPETLDCSQTKYGPKPTCQMTAEELQYAYLTQTPIVSTIRYNVLKDQRYIRFALHDTLRRAIALNYFNYAKLPDGSGIEAILETAINSRMLIGRSDTYGIMAEFINKLLAIEKHEGIKILNRNFVAKDMGLVTDPKISMDDFILSQSTGLEGRLDGWDPTNGRLTFERMIALRLLSGYVPIPLSDTHRVEKEDDDAVTRHFEMKLRVENMQKLVYDMFGDKIEFVANNTANDDGFASEVMQEKEAAPTFKVEDPSTTYITFDAKEKYLYDMTVFKYLFPHLTEGNLTYLVKTLRQAKQSSFWHTSAQHYAMIAGRFALAVLPIIRPFVKDLLNEHLLPVGDEKFYQQTQLLERFKAEPRNANLFPQFLGPNDVWHLDGQGKNVQTAAFIPAKASLPPSVPISY